MSRERRNRIRLAFAAYAYEFESTSIISDAEFDQLALAIRPEMSTVEPYHVEEQRRRYRRLDKFFRTKFSPHTGMWVHDHPELDRLRWAYHRFVEKAH